MPDTKQAPNDKPISTGTEGDGITDAQLHGDDARNAPSTIKMAGSKGWLAGKEPGGKR